MQPDLDELLGAQLEQQRAHLRLRPARQLPQPFQPPVQRGALIDLAKQAVGRERGGPQRLVDGVVQLLRQPLTLLGGRQLGRLAGETGVGDRRRRLIGDRPQPLGMGRGEEALGDALEDDEADAAIAHLQRRSERRPGRSEARTADRRR